MDERITEVVRYFNNNTSFDKVSTLSDWYVRQLTGAIDQFGVDTVKAVFDRADSSLFLSGKKIPGWKACFGWLIKPENIKNILQGKYDDYISTHHVLSPEDFASSLPDDELVAAALAKGFDGMGE